MTVMLPRVSNKSENTILRDLGGEGDIVEILSARLGYSKKVIEGPVRLQGIVKARHLIAYVLREYGDLSYPAIGRLLGGRDHTTIMHAYGNTKKNIAVHPELKSELEDLMREAGSIKERKFQVENYLIPKILESVKANNIKKAPLAFRKIPERSLKMLELWREGLTLQNISNVSSVTRERVRQIVIATIKQMAVNESLSRGIVIDSEVLVEEEVKRRKKLQESRKPKVSFTKKEKHWSRYYIACRSCGTTSMPHVKYGLCERCSGRYRGERRRSIIERHLNVCDRCRISRGDAVRKHGRDFYITKSQQVLCKGCFLQATGERLGNRTRQKKAQLKS